MYNLNLPDEALRNMFIETLDVNKTESTYTDLVNSHIWDMP